MAWIRETSAHEEYYGNQCLVFLFGDEMELLFDDGARPPFWAAVAQLGQAVSLVYALPGPAFGQLLASELLAAGVFAALHVGYSWAVPMG